MCIDRYLRRDQHYKVVDLGSRVVVAGHLDHRSLLEGYDVDYVGVDINAGPNVDVVMRKPYRIPLKSNSVDVVMTNQVFEHVPFPWVTFYEMCRVVKPGGLLFVIAPSRGHVHGAYDVWRFYPDAMRAFAAWARVDIVEKYTDIPPRLPNSNRLDYASIDTENRYWGHAVGVMRKPKRWSRAVRAMGEASVLWANRIGGLDGIASPRPDRQRRLLSGVTTPAP
ncbi:MAG: methyltransferase domain-containing protein [Jatrophihabitantaceae bacterium]